MFSVAEIVPVLWLYRAYTFFSENIVTATVSLDIQQTGQLAHKDAGDIRLGKALYFWKGLKQNLRPQRP